GEGGEGEDTRRWAGLGTRGDSRPLASTRACADAIVPARSRRRAAPGEQSPAPGPGSPAGRPGWNPRRPKKILMDYRQNIGPVIDPGGAIGNSVTWANPRKMIGPRHVRTNC
ncbi:hypothetical protein DC030_14940, partial [Enterococcus faecalis]